MKGRLGAQFTDQRAVGDALIDNAQKRFWSAQQGGVQAQRIYEDLTVTTAFSITGPGNTIQSPWGFFPGYLSMIDQDFDRANEKAWLIGAAHASARVMVPRAGRGARSAGRQGHGLSIRIILNWERDPF